MDPQYFLVIAVAVFMSWFAFGILYNLRRGNAMLKWMQGGLPSVGPRTTLRWLGSTVAELAIDPARSPFRRLETLLVLNPRDVPWMWLFAVLKGRRDILIFRAHLDSPPRVDLELADPASWTGRTALDQVTARGWESQSYRGLPLMAPRGMLPLAAATLDQLSGPAGRLAAHYWRFSLRREAPHLEVHLPFPNLRRVDAAEFFEAWRALARAAGQTPATRDQQ